MTPVEEAQVARGVRGRQIRRLLRVADRRAQRRMRSWLDAPPDEEWSSRNSRFTLYREAEDLLETLARLNISQGVQERRA